MRPAVKHFFLSVFILLVATAYVGSCKKTSGSGGTTPVTPPPVPAAPATSDVDFYLTTADQSSLLIKQNSALVFGTTVNSYPDISVDSTITYQTIDGFGYTLTGGSAQLINGLTSATKNALIQELFSNKSNAIGISYLRISIGASDMSSTVFTYDDMPAGQTDVNLQNFSIAAEKTDLIPLLKLIIAINPNIKILGTPWTAPAWMKSDTIVDNNHATTLNSDYYSAYADYIVKYLQAMKAEGISIDAITPQNEPLNANNNPSMVLPASKETEFIKNYLGPKLRAASLGSKIIIYDHNTDRTDYPLFVLGDAAANPYVDGSAFHLYAGNIGALSQVHSAYPGKNIHFTEQYTASTGNFSGDLNWHVKNLIVGASRNWSRNVLEWNLANDPNFGPHTNGGCTTCQGAITISGNNISRNVSYYIIAHASKFVPAASVRIASNVSSNLQNVAFVTPAGKKALIVLNDNSSAQSFNIKFKAKWATSQLPAGAVGTYVW